MTDQPIKIGAKITENVICADCQKTVAGVDVHSFRGKKGEDIYICCTCKEKIDGQFRAETENPNIPGAIVLGVIAGVVGSIVWYGVEIFTGYQIGYLAMGVGWLIGQAVVFGSGKKRGQALQLISTSIAFVSIWAASYFSTMYYTNQYWAEESKKSGEPFDGFYLLSPFDPEVLKAMISPIGLLIWGIGLYLAFHIPQRRKL